MPSTPSLPRPASRMALRTASTAIARVLRADCRLYSVSPTPTMQYLSLSAMGALRAGTLRERAGGRQARDHEARPGRAPGLARSIVRPLRRPLRVQDRREGAGGLGALDADDAAEPRDPVANAPGGPAAGPGPVGFLPLPGGPGFP